MPHFDYTAPLTLAHLLLRIERERILFERKSFFFVCFYLFIYLIKIEYFFLKVLTFKKCQIISLIIF